MAQNPLGPPPNVDQAHTFNRWMRLMYQRIIASGQILWSQIDFTLSNLTDIATRNHTDLQNLNTASYTHLTDTNHTDLTDGGDSTLHYHAADRLDANQTFTDVTTNNASTTAHGLDTPLAQPAAHLLPLSPLVTQTCLPVVNTAFPCGS